MRELDAESTLDFRKQEFLKLKDAASDFFEAERTKSKSFKKLEKFYGFNNAYSLEVVGDKRQFQLGFGCRPYEVRIGIDGSLNTLIEDSASLVFSQDSRGKVYVIVLPPILATASYVNSTFELLFSDLIWRRPLI